MRSTINWYDHMAKAMINSNDEAKPEPQFTAFQELARALFGVKREDVPKHEPKKREPKTADDRRRP